MAFPITLLDDEEVRGVLKEVFERASTDPVYREKALANPKAAIEEITGEELPENASTIRFQEEGNASASATFTLPDLVEQSDELSEEDLEQVAGGTEKIAGGSTCLITITCGLSCV